MVYLDYSATTPLDPRVGQVWLQTESTTFANANSSHALGVAAKAANDRAIEVMAKCLNVKPLEIIITASAVEANNFAIKGVAMKYPDKKHLITSALEHASLIGAVSALGDDYAIDFVDCLSDGTYDLEHLESLIKQDTLLISLVAVDSETGIRQPVEACAKIAHAHKVLFHSDITQALGKCAIDLNEIDLASCSAHKIYGPKGVGALIKKEHVGIVPLLHGGHSMTPFRSSTPPNGLVSAFSKALEIATTELNDRIDVVTQHHDYLKERLLDCPNIVFNSNEHSIPHITNLSILNSVPEKGLEFFSEHGVYCSSKSACSGQEEFSKSVYAITHDKQRAKTSYRISLSHLTTREELDTFIQLAKELANS